MSRTHTDLSIVAVSVAPSTATAGTSLGVTDANAAYLPDVYPWYALVKPAGSMPTRSNGEIVQVTAGSSSAGTTTYTIVRAQGVPVTTARSIIVGDEILEVHAAQHQANIDATQNSSLSRQALINGNFDVWQRGTTVTDPATSTLLSDRWKVGQSADGGTFPTMVHTKQSLTSGDIYGSFNFYRIAPNGAGTSLGNGSNYSITQYIENGTRFLCGDGKKVTLSFYARSSIASKTLGITLIQNYGTGGSPTSQEIITGTAVALTSGWVKYTYTFTTNTLVGKTFGTDNNDYLRVFFNYYWGSTGNTNYGGGAATTALANGTIDIAQVQLCAGDVALPFQPKSFEEELRACQRYYEKSFSYVTVPAQNAGTSVGHYRFVGLTAGATAQRSSEIFYKNNKRNASTTITLYNPSATNAQVRDASAGADCSNSAAIQLNESYFHIDCTGNASTALGNSLTVHWTAENEL